jgi:hypothetical protein
VLNDIVSLEDVMPTIMAFDNADHGNGLTIRRPETPPLADEPIGLLGNHL